MLGSAVMAGEAGGRVKKEKRESKGTGSGKGERKNKGGKFTCNFQT